MKKQKCILDVMSVFLLFSLFFWCLLLLLSVKTCQKYSFPTRKDGKDTLLQKSIISPTFSLCLHSIQSCTRLFYIGQKTIQLVTELDVCDKMLFAIPSMYQYISTSVLWRFQMPSMYVATKSHSSQGSHYWINNSASAVVSMNQNCP